MGQFTNIKQSAFYDSGFFTVPFLLSVYTVFPVGPHFWKAFPIIDYFTIELVIEWQVCAEMC